MFEFNVLFSFICIVCWIWVSVKLFRVYAVGTEVYFSVVYKANQSHPTSELRRIFIMHLTILWSIEVVTGIASLITSAMILKA